VKGTRTLVLVVPAVPPVTNPCPPRQVFRTGRPRVVKCHDNHSGLDAFQRCFIGWRGLDQSSARLWLFQYSHGMRLRQRDAHMCPRVSVLTGKSAERNALMRISSTDDIGDGTSVGNYSQSLSRNEIQVDSYASRSAALSSVPSGYASWTSKSLLLRMKTT
jgi:hypothetical protein